MFLSVRSNRAELLDGDAIPVERLAENFQDISRVNRLFGGTAVVLRLLERVLANRPAQAWTLLDVATGAADIPAAVLAWAVRRGIPIEITATDVSEEVLVIARRQARAEIKLERADACALPYRDGQFDIVTCSLALHHFSDDEAVTALREMRRVARHALIINDLRRCLSGYLAARAFAAFCTRNELTRNDAPLSVERAFTTAELAALARRAELGEVEIESQRGWRLSLLCTVDSSSRGNLWRIKH